MELHAAFGLRCRERIKLKNGEWGEIAWGGSVVPLDITRIKAGCKTVGKPRVGIAKSGHLALEFFVGHASGVADDDGQIGCRDVICRGVAVS